MAKTRTGRLFPTSRTVAVAEDGRASAPARAMAAGRDIPVDPFRLYVFPNAIREQRRRRGFDSLMALAAELPDIPYIRLSKIERGEVIPKASELQALAAALDMEPSALLVDVGAPDYSISLWAGLRGETLAANREGEEMAMLLAAAFRARRASDPSLTLMRLQSEFGLPPVIVSRLENAVKTPDRWNPATMSAICAMLGIVRSSDLYPTLRAMHDDGTLSPHLERIPGAADREARTREAIARLRTELAEHRPARRPLPSRQTVPLISANVASDPAPLLSPGPALLPILGVPAADGIILLQPAGGEVVPPPRTGPNAYALRMGRPSLGAAIPGQAILIVDPDRYPIHGGPAVIREGEGVRAVAICIDREGRMVGHSNSPEKAIPLDAVPPNDLAMVTAILFI